MWGERYSGNMTAEYFMTVVVCKWCSDHSEHPSADLHPSLPPTGCTEGRTEQRGSRAVEREVEMSGEDRHRWVGGLKVRNSGNGGTEVE